MKRGLRALAIILTAVVAMLGWNMPASHAAGTGAAIMNGTISPGLGTGTTVNTISMSGTLAGADSSAGAGVCNLTGSGTIVGSIISGSGLLTMDCSGSFRPWSHCAGSVTYVGSYWIWVPVCAGVNGNSVWVCVGEFNNINPTTSIGWVCEVVYY